MAEGIQTPAGGNGNNLTLQGYVAIGVVVAVLITLFTLSNLIPFVYKAEFSDFKTVMLQNFADIKVSQADDLTDRRDLHSSVENMRLDIVELDARVTTLQNWLDSEDSAQAITPPPMPPLIHHSYHKKSNPSLQE